MIFNIGALLNNQAVHSWFAKQDSKLAGQLFLQAASHFQEIQQHYSNHFVIEVINLYLQIT